MTITYPITDMMSLLRVGDVSFEQKWRQEATGTANGQLIIKELAPALWAASLKSVPLNHDQLRQVQARINSMYGSIGYFQVYNPIGPYPQADPVGTIIGNANVVINTLDADTLRMKLGGLPVGYQLKFGDFLSFVYSTSKIAFHQIMENATADGTGVTPLFEVRPSIRTGAAVGNPVTLKKPWAEMRIVPGTVAVASHDVLTSTVQFEAIQRIT